MALKRFVIVPPDFVGGENAPAGRHHGLCHFAQLSEVHDPLHPSG